MGCVREISVLPTTQTVGIILVLRRLLMFMTSSMLMVIIVVEFFAGCVIGVAVVALMYRSQLRLGLALRGALIAGMALLLMAGVTGWAGWHVEFVNGQRQDVTSWGEHLWLRNRLSAYQLPLCIGSSIVAAVLTSVFWARNNRRE
jgi:hypothetical protein